MNVLGRDGSEWTLIWPDDEERHTVAVADGHGVPPEHGWTMIPVVRADAYRGAVAALEEIERYFIGGWPDPDDLPRVRALARAGQGKADWPERGQ